MVHALLNLLFPKRCVGCNTRDYYLCPNCSTTIEPADPTEVPDTFAVFHYHNPKIKRLIWQLKYHNGWSIAEDLAPYLYGRIIEELADYLTYYPNETIIVIPTPLSKKKLHKRGYNQAEKLAKSLAKRYPELFSYSTAVIKTKETTSQVEVKDRHKRLENLRGAFEIKKPAEIAGRTILIIDDVLTTGGTILELQQTLKKAGAKRVFGLAVAHG